MRSRANKHVCACVDIIIHSFYNRNSNTKLGIAEAVEGLTTLVTALPVGKLMLPSLLTVAAAAAAGGLLLRAAIPSLSSLSLVCVSVFVRVYVCVCLFVCMCVRMCVCVCVYVRAHIQL
jgi:hypothetical protein